MPGRSMLTIVVSTHSYFRSRCWLSAIDFFERGNLFLLARTVRRRRAEHRTLHRLSLSATRTLMFSRDSPFDPPE